MFAPLKVGVIGLGRMGQLYARHIYLAEAQQC